MNINNSTPKVISKKVTNQTKKLDKMKNDEKLKTQKIKKPTKPIKNN